jgi:transposase
VRAGQIVGAPGLEAAGALRSGATGVPVVDAAPPIWRPVGEPDRPRRRPAKLYGDNGDDCPVPRRAPRRRGITSRIARRGVASSQRLGCSRWTVERTIAWPPAFRRLTVRYDRHAASVLAFLHLHLARTPICLRSLPRAPRVEAI